MRGVIITPNLYGFDQKSQFFEEQSWYKFNDFRLDQVWPENLQLCEKRIKTKSVAGKQPFLHFPPPPIPNRAKGKFTDSRSVKTIKKEKHTIHWLIDCNVEITCIPTVTVLENMFGNIKSAVFTFGGIGEGECAVELACLPMLNISLRKIPKVGTIVVLTYKNQTTNYKYLHTYIE